MQINDFNCTYSVNEFQCPRHNTSFLFFFHCVSFQMTVPVTSTCHARTRTPCKSFPRSPTAYRTPLGAITNNPCSVASQPEWCQLPGMTQTPLGPLSSCPLGMAVMWCRERTVMNPMVVGDHMGVRKKGPSRLCANFMIMRMRPLSSTKIIILVRFFGLLFLLTVS